MTVKATPIVTIILRPLSFLRTVGVELSRDYQVTRNKFQKPAIGPSSEGSVAGFVFGAQRAECVCGSGEYIFVSWTHGGGSLLK
jgi:hypothetical protein